ncbi:MAG: hypothetical protein M3P33_03780 [bacterium]|nr:hypothetical protein [bacterium]
MNSTQVTVSSILDNFVSQFVLYMPQFIAGLVLIIIGLIVASLIGGLVSKLLKIFKVSSWIDNAEGIFSKATADVGEKSNLWPNILATLVKWTVFIMFLLPALDAWNLGRVTLVLNQLILFIPNIFVAVVVGFIGLGIAKLVHTVVLGATGGVTNSSARLLANLAKYALIFFVSLIVLNQLGVAANLVQILFTGIVAMLALAGGLAFGIGGQEKARQLLESLTLKVNETKSTINANRT